MEIVILAGGFGSRLREAVSDLPKPMSPVGNRPFLAWLMDWFIQCGATRFILAVGYMSEKIIDYFGNEYRDRPILYSVEKKPLGTGGALKQALGMTVSPNVIVANGDSILQSDIRVLMEEHLKNKATLTVALKSARQFDRYGAVQHANGIIMRFCEKSYTEEGEFNAGVYAVNCGTLMSIMDKSEEKFSFEETVLSSPFVLKRCCCFDDYFIDIGIPEDYQRAQEELPRIFATL